MIEQQNEEYLPHTCLKKSDTAAFEHEQTMAKHLAGMETIRMSHQIFFGSNDVTK